MQQGEAHDKSHTQGSWVVLGEWSLLYILACLEWSKHHSMEWPLPTTSHQHFLQYDFTL